jgi:hypothetical protein
MKKKLNKVRQKKTSAVSRTCGDAQSQFLSIRHRLKAAACVLIVLSFGTSVRALTFNISYDSSVTNRADYAQIRTAINYVVLEYTSLFTNDITINILIQADPTIGGGESWEVTTVTTYSSLRNALIAHAKTADALTAVASLPATDPTSGGHFEMAIPEAKALGLHAAHDSGSDGTIGFGADDPWAYDPANRGMPDKEDFIGTMEHEFSEVMGRNTDRDYMPNWFQPFDLFRYSAAHVRSFDENATNAYFSIDGGLTNLKQFNPVSTGDLMDWNDISSPPDSFDAFGPYDAETPLTKVDLTVMDILGYSLNTKPPQITNFTRMPNNTFALSGTGIVGQTYLLVASTNLFPLIIWTPIDTNISVLNGNFSFTDPQASNYPQRFYRVSLP